MPKLPDQRVLEYISAGLKPSDAELIAYNAGLARFFEATLEVYAGEAQRIANWLCGDIAGYLNQHDLEIGAVKLGPRGLAGLVKLIDDGVISGRIAKDILGDVMNGANPLEIVEARGLMQVSDEGAIDAAVAAVVAGNADVVAQIRSGNAKAVNALFGRVMKEMGGKANPEVVRAALEKAVG